LLIGSGEYFQSRGGSTNDGFLTALYSDALGRAVDPTALSGFGLALAAGFSRSQLALAVLTSPEYKTDLIQSYYQKYLRRPADQAGLTTFVALLGSQPPGLQPIFTGNSLLQRPPIRDEDIIAMLVGSQEYLNRLGS